jgi:hypothetical protein
VRVDLESIFFFKIYFPASIQILTQPTTIPRLVFFFLLVFRSGGVGYVATAVASLVRKARAQGEGS